MQFTIFKSIKDNKTDKTVELDSFEDFEKLLYQLSEQPVRKPKKGELPQTGDAMLISPAVYKPTTDPDNPITRANVNVVRWDFACLDVDDYEGPFQNVIESLGSWYFVCYSTASSTKEHPKFRLVFPLQRSVMVDELRHFWYALNKEVLDIGDAQTKDMARMFYVPGQYPNAHNFIFTRPGPIMDPDALMEKHPYDATQDCDDFMARLPTDMQERLLTFRKSQTVKKGQVDWHNVTQCRYVSRKAISSYLEAVVADTGKYHGMYKFMVSVAFSAIRDGYDIDKNELSTVARALDREHGNHYEFRPLTKEADRAIEYAYRNKG